MTAVRLSGRERVTALPARANLAPVLAAAAVLLTGVTLAERGTPSRAVVWGAWHSPATRGPSCSSSRSATGYVRPWRPGGPGHGCSSGTRSRSGSPP